MAETADRLNEQEKQGENQFYIYKRGLIQVLPADFSGTTAFKSTEVVRIPGSEASTILLNSFDVYHWVQDPAAEIEGDEEIIRLNYNFGTQKANARLWYRYYAGAPGYIGINIDIYYTADGASGSPYSADETQNFYYMLYTQQPI